MGLFGLSLIVWFPLLVVYYSQKWIRRMIRKPVMAFKMCRNAFMIHTLSSPRVHYYIADKIINSGLHGDVIECGTYKGGSASNLSLACKMAGKKLLLFDSFEGLPQNDWYDRGEFAGNTDEVMKNIKKYGDIACCEFYKGWFEETLPSLNRPIMLAWLDVDLPESLHTCVLNIWRNLVDGGYIFIDECMDTNYSALFYSEKWWDKYFSCKPPGLIGAGTGLPLGQIYPHSGSGAFTRKGMSGSWYFTDE